MIPHSDESAYGLNTHSTISFNDLFLPERQFVRCKEIEGVSVNSWESIA